MCFSNLIDRFCRTAGDALEWIVREERPFKNVVREYTCELADLASHVEIGAGLFMVTDDFLVAHFAIVAAIKHGRVFVIHDPGDKGANAASCRGFLYEPIEDVVGHARQWALMRCEAGVNSTLCRLATKRRAFAVLSGNMLLGIRAYSVLRRNCEHMVSHCLYGLRFSRSTQVLAHVESLANCVIGLATGVACSRLTTDVVSRLLCFGVGTLIGYKFALVVVSTRLRNRFSEKQLADQSGDSWKRMEADLSELVRLKDGGLPLTAVVLGKLEELKTDIFGLLCMEHAMPENTVTAKAFRKYERCVNAINELTLQYFFHVYRLCDVTNGPSIVHARGLTCVQWFLLDEPLLPAPWFHVLVLERVHALAHAWLRCPATPVRELCALICGEIVNRYDDELIRNAIIGTDVGNVGAIRDACSRLVRVVKSKVDELMKNAASLCQQIDDAAQCSEAASDAGQKEEEFMSSPTVLKLSSKDGLLKYLETSLAGMNE